MDYDLKRSQNTVRFESAYKNIKIKKIKIWNYFYIEVKNLINRIKKFIKLIKHMMKEIEK